MCSEQWGWHGFTDLFIKDVWEGSTRITVKTINCHTVPSDPAVIHGLWVFAKQSPLEGSAVLQLLEQLLSQTSQKFILKVSWFWKMWVTPCLEYSKGPVMAKAKALIAWVDVLGWWGGLQNPAQEGCWCSWAANLEDRSFPASSSYFEISTSESVFQYLTFSKRSICML